MEKNKSYLGIGLSVGMIGIEIAAFIFFAPLIFILPLFMEMEYVQLIFYILTAVSAFFILYFIRKKKTNEKSFHFSSPNTPVLPLVIIGTLAFVYGVMFPLFELFSVSDSFTENRDYQSLLESVGANYPLFIERFGDKLQLLIERLTSDFPMGIPIFFLMVVIAPVFEELIYRGIILDGLLKRYSAVTSILVSSVLFGVIHLNPLQFFPAFAAGIFMGWIYHKTRNLTLTILIHACMNLTGFVEGYLLQTFPKYEESTIELYGGLIPSISIMIVSILVFVVCVLFLKKWFNKQQDNLII